MARVPRTREDIEDQLREQLELLQELIGLYDTGKTVAAKSIASSIRVLVHDTPLSHALLQQAGMLDRDFYNTVEIRDEREGGAWAGSYSALVGVAFGGAEPSFVPNLDSGAMPRWTPFADYWDEIIFIDREENSFTRKDIILAVANQDGGSHVDPGLDPKYKELSRNNSLGHFKGREQTWEGLKGAELASIRQVAHEMLKTLIPNYETPLQTASQGFVVGGVGVVLYTETAEEQPSRQGPCPCGSGKKYKRCHGS